MGQTQKTDLGIDIEYRALSTAFGCGCLGGGQPQTDLPLKMQVWIDTLLRLLHVPRLRHGMQDAADRRDLWHKKGLYVLMSTLGVLVYSRN